MYTSRELCKSVGIFNTRYQKYKYFKKYITIHNKQKIHNSNKICYRRYVVFFSKNLHTFLDGFMYVCAPIKSVLACKNYFKCVWWNFLPLFQWQIHKLSYYILVYGQFFHWRKYFINLYDLNWGEMLLHFTCSMYFHFYGLATLNWPRFFPCPISETNGLVTHSKISQFSVDTSAYFFVSQIYRKQNRTRKESRSLHCGQAVNRSKYGLYFGFYLRILLISQRTT